MVHTEDENAAAPDRGGRKPTLYVAGKRSRGKMGGKKPRIEGGREGRRVELKGGLWGGPGAGGYRR